MFNSNKPSNSKQARKVPATRDSAVTILTSGCHFNGKLYCRGSSRIGGRIEGEVISEGMLIVEEAAVITAEVTADEVIIQGSVKGKLTAKGRVELAATSKFDGDISTPTLIIHEGAQFNGRAHMEITEDNSKGLARISDIGSRAPELGELGHSEDQPDVAVMSVSEVPSTT